MTMTMNKKVVQWAMMLALAAMTWAGFVQEGKAFNDYEFADFGSPDFMNWQADNCALKGGVMECKDDHDVYRDSAEDINYGYDFNLDDIFYYNSWETYDPGTTKIFENLIDMDLYNLHKTPNFKTSDISGYIMDYGIELGRSKTDHMGFINQFNPIHTPFLGGGYSSSSNVYEFNFTNLREILGQDASRLEGEHSGVIPNSGFGCPRPPLKCIVAVALPPTSSAEDNSSLPSPNNNQSSDGASKSIQEKIHSLAAGACNNITKITECGEKLNKFQIELTKLTNDAAPKIDDKKAHKLYGDCVNLKVNFLAEAFSANFNCAKVLENVFEFDKAARQRIAQSECGQCTDLAKSFINKEGKLCGNNGYLECFNSHSNNQSVPVPGTTPGTIS